MTELNQNSLLLEMVRELKSSIEKLADKVDSVDKRLVVLEAAGLKEMSEQIRRIDKNQAIIYAIAGFLAFVAGLLGDFIKGIFS